MGVLERARQQWPFSTLPISHWVRMFPGGRFIVFQTCPEGIKIDSRAWCGRGGVAAWGGHGGVAAASLGCKVLVQCRRCGGGRNPSTPSLIPFCGSSISSSFSLGCHLGIVFQA